MAEGFSQQHPAEQGGGGFFSREAMGSIPWMVIGKLVLFFVYFGISIIVVNGLGKESYGVYSLMVNIAQYMLMLCGMGLGVALMRYVPELAARKNRFGLIHLLWKSATLQLIAILVGSMVLLSFSGQLQRLFKAEHVEHFRFYLKLACGLTGLLLLKDFVGTVFTSLFKTRTVAILSIAQGCIWFVSLWVWLGIRPAVGTVFAVQMVSVGVVYLVGAATLYRYVKDLPWAGREFGIGKKRALSFSGTIMLSSILRTVMFKYSEVFFLAAVAGTTVAGIYDLGYTLPYTLITFLPLAFLPIFTSAFAEAYVKDNDCLGRLIKSYYKVLMMVSLPVAILGAYFAPAAYHILYKGEMDQAGYVASAFCMVLVLPLVSMPLSAAIKAKEKVLNMVPMLVLQIVVNLLLDWLLIVHYRMGVWGGILAVVGTFVLTIPFRMMVVRGILGGIFFPAAFCLRITAALAALGMGFHWVSEKISLFQLVDNRLANLFFLFAVGALYLGLFLVAIRHLRLIRKADVEDFQALDIEKLNALIRLLVK